MKASTPDKHKIVVICIVLGIIIIGIAVYINNQQQKAAAAAYAASLPNVPYKQPLALTVLQDATPLALLVPELA